MSVHSFCSPNGAGVTTPEPHVQDILKQNYDMQDILQVLLCRTRRTRWLEDETWAQDLNRRLPALLRIWLRPCEIGSTRCRPRTRNLPTGCVPTLRASPS